GEIHVRLVIRIAGVGEDLGNLVHKNRGRLQLSQEGLDALWREGPEPLPGLWAVQHLGYLGQCGLAHVDRDVAVPHQPETRSCRAGFPGCSLQADHAVEDDTRLHPLAHSCACLARLSALTSSRTSVRNSLSSSSVMPLSATSLRKGARIS